MKIKSISPSKNENQKKEKKNEQKCTTFQLRREMKGKFQE